MLKKGPLATLWQQLNILWFAEHNTFKWQKGIKLGKASWKAVHLPESQALEQYKHLNFLLHLLRPGDIFVDADASVGPYSILASAVRAAYVYSFEPNPSAFEQLQYNIQLNHLEPLVTARQCALGAFVGELPMPLNHPYVIDRSSVAPNLNTVPQITLDNSVPRQPNVIRMSAKAVQRGAFEGAIYSLSLSSVKIVLLEQASQEPGVQKDLQELHEKMLGFHFVAYDYNPEYKKLQNLNPQNQRVGIYCRDLEWIEMRLDVADDQIIRRA